MIAKFTLIIDKMITWMRSSTELNYLVKITFFRRDRNLSSSFIPSNRLSGFILQNINLLTFFLKIVVFLISAKHQDIVNLFTNSPSNYKLKIILNN